MKTMTLPTNVASTLRSENKERAVTGAPASAPRDGYGASPRKGAPGVTRVALFGGVVEIGEVTGFPFASILGC